MAHILLRSGLPMSPTVRINQFSDENRRKRRLVKMKSILGVLHDLLHAERVVRQLHERGISSKDISLLVPDREGGSGVDPAAAAAGLLGGALAMLAGVSVLVVPGLGPLVAAGPLLSAVSAAMAGTTMGGIASGLITLGVPELEARRYEKKVRGGHLLLSVHADSAEDLQYSRTLFETELVDDVCATSDVRPLTSTSARADGSEDPIDPRSRIARDVAVRIPK